LAEPAALTPVVSTLVFIPVFAFVIWRQMRGRRFKVTTMWILPTILVGFCCFEIAPHLSWSRALAIGLALSLGTVVGLVRARVMHVEPLPETGEIHVKGTPLMLLVILVLFGAKRLFLPTTNAAPADLVAMTDLMMAFAVGTIVVRTGTLYAVYFEARRVSVKAAQERLAP
jgi:hypothetical protein